MIVTSGMIGTIAMNDTNTAIIATMIAAVAVSISHSVLVVTTPIPTATTATAITRAIRIDIPRMIATPPRAITMPRRFDITITIDRRTVMRVVTTTAVELNWN